ncbi:TLR adapter interacting with SLC15A4 on the lysosome-like [Hyla sarda]|uniref:TLR adapter interacting with SLC15A4 on the lysosome-like n=1 Tax=Hyla sarda TaxID=327740 RepID=UPI0024C21878|nr:TLR adapter interacting with SLC15A4 on the lysosome-like [Hyla sarda]XP_056395030.1 TLR adapter interacting with SLC15A4 on the lysosome-like [Hyla sarda]
MLSESFLCTAVYRELMHVEERKEREKEKPLKTTSFRKPGASVRREHGLYGSDLSGAPSQALAIPKREALTADSLDLYTSWSSPYGSIYKNYPDLHIAGDHILHKVDSGCILDTDGEDGPVLLSADIISTSPPNENPGGLPEEAGAPSVESQTLPSAPFSNSVLNGFLEKKMQELYKQCYEETLTAGASPHAALWSTILMHNVHQISLQISQEKNVDQAKAKQAVLQCLCCATSGGSSEFITPVLHISGQDNNKTKTTALPSNPTVNKSCRGNSKKIMAHNNE